MMWRYAATPLNGLKKLAATRTATLIERAADRLLRAPVLHTVTSERERQKLAARNPRANIQVIPNGVDAAYFARGAKPNPRAGRAGDSSKRTIVFVGSMDYHANIDAVARFARGTWPEIARKHPDLQFVIVGRDPAPAIRALASTRIRVTGTVEDVRPFYDAAIAAVAPMHSGRGTRLKILEAMAAGVPVVSTRLGAEGIDVENDVHILLAESGPELVAAVDRVVSSTETRERLSVAAGTLVADRYDWSVVGESLYRIHRGVVETRRRGVSQPEAEAGMEFAGDSNLAGLQP
jgi:glycosyltransferase involved in cell wall biosynthesis